MRRKCRKMNMRRNRGETDEDEEEAEQEEERRTRRVFIGMTRSMTMRGERAKVIRETNQSFDHKEREREIERSVS